MIELYLDLGMDPGQMVIGVPTHGRGFQLEDNDLNGKSQKQVAMKLPMKFFVQASIVLPTMVSQLVPTPLRRDTTVTMRYNHIHTCS